MQLKIFPPFYVLFVAILMILMHKFYPVVQIVSDPWIYVSSLFFIVAVLINIYSMRLFARKSTTFSPTKLKDTSSLVVNGAYHFTRNPMYLGLFSLLVGFAFWLGSLTPFFVLPIFYWLITEMQIKPEEKVLEDKFGSSYLDYKNNVRRWL